MRMNDNHNAAYDLGALRSGAAEKRRNVKQNKQNRAKVVRLPQDDIHRIRRRRHNPLKVFLGAAAGVVIAIIISTIIVGRVQLTELNQQIISAKEELETARSTYTQVEMAIQSKLSTTEVEKYAVDKLGMSKAENAQKEFVSLSEGDKAEVSPDANRNFFRKIIDAITGLWS